MQLAGASGQCRSVLKSDPIEFAPQILDCFEEVATGHKEVHAVRRRDTTIVYQEYAFRHFGQLTFDPADRRENVLPLALICLPTSHVQTLSN